MHNNSPCTEGNVEEKNSIGSRLICRDCLDIISAVIRKEWLICTD
nr:MAG TPA: hypothetical protein [Caudoviricetes sp.]